MADGERDPSGQGVTGELDRRRRHQEPTRHEKTPSFAEELASAKPSSDEADKFFPGEMHSSTGAEAVETAGDDVKSSASHQEEADSNNVLVVDPAATDLQKPLLRASLFASRTDDRFALAAGLTARPNAAAARLARQSILAMAGAAQPVARKGPQLLHSTSRGARKKNRLERVGSTMAHYLSLVVASNPVEEHRLFLERKRAEEQAQPESSRLRPTSSLGAARSLRPSQDVEQGGGGGMREPQQQQQRRQGSPPPNPFGAATTPAMRSGWRSSRMTQDVGSSGRRGTSDLAGLFPTLSRRRSLFSGTGEGAGGQLASSPSVGLPSLFDPTTPQPRASLFAPPTAMQRTTKDSFLAPVAGAARLNRDLTLLRSLPPRNFRPSASLPRPMHRDPASFSPQSSDDPTAKPAPDQSLGEQEKSPRPGLGKQISKVAASDRGFATQMSAPVPSSSLGRSPSQQPDRQEQWRPSLAYQTSMERRRALMQAQSSFQRSTSMLPEQGLASQLSAPFALLDSGAAPSPVKQGYFARRKTLTRLGSNMVHYIGVLTAQRQQMQEGDEQQQLMRQSLLGQGGEVDEEAQERDFTLQLGAQLAQDGMMEEEEEVREQLEAEMRRALNIARWQIAAQAVVSSAAMSRDARTLADRGAPPLDRLTALVDLEWKLAGSPHKKLLMHALLKKHHGKFDNLADQMLTELFITGEKIFDWFTPAQIGRHHLLFTPLSILVLLLLFFFMAGSFPFYFMRTSPLAYQAEDCLTAHNLTGYGVTQLEYWINPKGHQWCYGPQGTPTWQLSPDFLIDWGGRYGPLIAQGQAYRWFSSVLLHQSFQHVFSNCLLFLVVAHQEEFQYGWWRVALLYVVSAIGGAFFSATFESDCEVVVGASGGVFGMMGLFIADMVLNFRTLSRPILRSLLVVALLVYVIVTVTTSPRGVSNLSHVGGFICGLFPSFLFLPHLSNEKYEAFLPILGGLVMLMVFIGLPLHIYLNILPHLKCD